jgi:hypothetical protein
MRLVGVTVSTCVVSVSMPLAAGSRPALYRHDGATR